jgi:large subunit ribosomal protein L35
MPKQKTHKGLSKRVKVSATGKVMRKRAGAGHLMSTKSGNRCRCLGKSVCMTGAMARKIKQALGV